MARPVDPERHQQQRLRIIDAALTCFARDGVDAATTAQVCREAGISSGTFFHYFPTKLDVLRGIFDVGQEETRTWFAELDAFQDPLKVLMAHARRAADEATDARTAGFVAAVSGVMGRPEVAALLEAEQQLTRQGLLPWVERARSQGRIRTDWSAQDTVSWILAVEDGFVASVAGTAGFDAADQADALLDVIDRMLRPPGE